MLSIANGKDIEKLITEELRPRGFRKKQANWYLTTDDCVCMVNLQKSPWGGQYYINIGVLVTEIDKNENPQEHKCHIRARLDDLVSNGKQLEKALDVESKDMPAAMKASLISSALSESAIPALLSMATIDGIKRVIQKNDKILGRTSRSIVERLFPEWYAADGKWRVEGAD